MNNLYIILFIIFVFIYLINYFYFLNFIKKSDFIKNNFYPLNSRYSIYELFELQNILSGIFIQYNLYYKKNGRIPLIDESHFYFFESIKKDDLIKFIEGNYNYLRFNFLGVVVGLLFFIFSLVFFLFD